MKPLKLLVLICVAISFSQCKTMKLTETAPFKVTGATYHNWVGGQPGISGTNLIIGVENDANITFKKVYFQNRIVDANLTNRNEKKYVQANISTSNRDDSTLVKEGSVKKPKIDPEPIPFNLKLNEAVISYMVGKKTYYYKVSRIKKTDTIYYP